MVMTQPKNGRGGDMEQVAVRKATRADFPVIREIARLSRKEAFSHFMDDDDIASEIQKYYSDEELGGILDNPANAIFVAEKGGQVLGYCSILPADRKGRPRLLQFYVRPNVQRQGVGSALFDRGSEFLRQAGKNEMFISTIRANNIGRAFFDKKGCQLINEYSSTWDGNTHIVSVFYKQL